MKEEFDGTFLSRWLNNELNDSELDEFKHHPYYALYQKIAMKSEELSVPTYNKEKLYSRVQREISESKKGKVKNLYTKLSIGVVASIAILFTVFQLYNSGTTHTTSFGEQMALNLPDGSEVLLNSKSEISYNETTWTTNRMIELKGEAFFKVQKGSNFVVNTDMGSVTVLGTQFSIISKDDLIEVSCYEGEVKVDSEKKVIFLTKGKAYRSINGISEKWKFNGIEPSWKNGESSFVSIPLKYVIDAIENQYSVQIDASKINSENKFTGAFTHESLNIALETVFQPLKIEAKIVDKSRIILVKK
ncbi:hypothetical protein BTO06_17530 [Tenacibaculum sp. SZ-18]|uniref:FecR family protein n=1 Tax=Tenacibaculum sp. SZ-18 TaxID=754423 RepID=UPI000C2D0E72|nr:FecR family protein [Tenacibaculum sp. SZ-18]AUC16834.1 hypothetical protein BTO06_17530 [Tenacibaculum sp. SZ-18]